MPARRSQGKSTRRSSHTQIEQLTILPINSSRSSSLQITTLTHPAKCSGVLLTDLIRLGSDGVLVDKGNNWMGLDGAQVRCGTPGPDPGDAGVPVSVSRGNATHDEIGRSGV